MKSIQSPLVINIFWHNENKELHQIANILYEFYSNNIDNPLDNYLNIPVRLYPYIPNEVGLLQLPMAQHSANVFLIDDKMVIDKDWRAFSKKMLAHLGTLAPHQHRLFPIAISSNAYNFNKKLSRKNFIRWHDEIENTPIRYLLLNLSHDLTRLLYETSNLLPSSTRYTKLPIKLFLSHAKKDGRVIAENIRDYIHSESGMDFFFDALDIPTSVDFSEEIEEQIKESILVVIQSNTYSSRQWCRKEVLSAKAHNCPIIVINQLDKSEYRSFPYIGNIPHLYFRKDEEEQQMLNQILLEAIREALRFRHNSLKVYHLAKTFGKTITTALAYPPELVTLAKINSLKNKIVLYPDPPIGEEELNLIESFSQGLKFITPTLLPLLSDDGQQVKSLEGLKITISLSEIQHSEYAWLHNRGIQNLMVEICRYLLVSGAQLIYAGKLNYNDFIKEEEGFNFTALLIEIIKSYQQIYEGEAVKPMENYAFYPINTLITDDDQANLMDVVNFQLLPPPQHLTINKQETKRVLNNSSTAEKRIWSDCLTDMRKKIMANTNALIVLGGKSLNFKGKMPGVLEEVLLAFEAQKPIFLIGAFGGVASTVVQALEGQKELQKLSLTYYETNYQSYAFFIKKYNEQWAREEEQVDYPKINQFLNQQGKKYEDFGLNNGLSRAENERLFHSHSEIEILTLLFKGLKNITDAKSI